MTYEFYREEKFLDPLTQDMLIAFSRLKPLGLYTAAEAAAVVYDPKDSLVEHRKLARKIWRVVNERKWSDLKSWPDNCEIDSSGMPRCEHTPSRSRVVLLPNEIYPRWQGNTLITALNDDEILWLWRYKLIVHLAERATGIRSSCEEVVHLNKNNHQSKCNSQQKRKTTNIRMFHVAIFLLLTTIISLPIFFLNANRKPKYIIPDLVVAAGNGKVYFPDETVYNGDQVQIAGKSWAITQISEKGAVLSRGALVEPLAWPRLKIYESEVFDVGMSFAVFQPSIWEKTKGTWAVGYFKDEESAKGVSLHGVQRSIFGPLCEIVTAVADTHGLDHVCECGENKMAFFVTSWDLETWVKLLSQDGASIAKIEEERLIVVW